MGNLNDRPGITAAELLLLFAAVPSHARVVLEGCDCMGVATHVDVEPDAAGNPLMVMRRKFGSGYPGTDAFPDEEPPE